jgi:hypothetical protein
MSLFFKAGVLVDQNELDDLDGLGYYYKSFSVGFIGRASLLEAQVALWSLEA